MNIRALAAEVLHKISEGRALDTALAGVDNSHPNLEARDRGLISALVHAALRHRMRYQNAMQPWIKQAPAPKVRALLLIAFADLHALETPPHAAVDQAVAAARVLKMPQCAGMVNAVLRRFLRENTGAAIDQMPAEIEFPDWLSTRLKTAYPEDFAALTRASLRPAPMWLRVRPENFPGYADRLAANNIAVSDTHPDAPHALCLQEPVPVSSLPGFDVGEVTVQDPGAQFAGALLNPQRGEILLDACAAPGGKTAHLLQLAGIASLLAIDKDKVRLRLVGNTLLRMRQRAELAAGDAAAVLARPEFVERRFDAILLDAPCSASGVIRRHPDILQLRRESDLAELAREQRRLLLALYPRLKPGGRLLYATCSILPEENDAPIAALLEKFPSAQVQAIQLQTGQATRFGRQWLPLRSTLQSGADALATDGFYYCLVRSPA